MWGGVVVTKAHGLQATETPHFCPLTGGLVPWQLLASLETDAKAGVSQWMTALLCALSALDWRPDVWSPIHWRAGWLAAAASQILPRHSSVPLCQSSSSFLSSLLSPKTALLLLASLASTPAYSCTSSSQAPRSPVCPATHTPDRTAVPNKTRRSRPRSRPKQFNPIPLPLALCHENHTPDVQLETLVPLPPPSQQPTIASAGALQLLSAAFQTPICRLLSFFFLHLCFRSQIDPSTSSSPDPPTPPSLRQPLGTDTLTAA